MSDAARKEMLRLLTIDEDQMPEVPADSKYDYLYTLTYRDFLGTVDLTTDQHIIFLASHQAVRPQTAMCSSAVPAGTSSSVTAEST